MFNVLIQIGNNVFITILQIAAGCAIAVAVCPAVCRRFTYPEKTGSRLGIIILSSFCGIVMPFGIYGIIPLVAILVVSKMPGFLFIPLMVSNMLFNLLVPFYGGNLTVVFAAELGATALAAGTFAGIIVLNLKKEAADILRKNTIEKLGGNVSEKKSLGAVFSTALLVLGPYFVAGAAANYAFNNYLLMDMLNLVYMTKAGRSAAGFFLNYNITTDSFLLASTITNVFMDMTKISALFAIFKLQWIVTSFVYYFIWVVVLVLPVFFLGKTNIF